MNEVLNLIEEYQFIYSDFEEEYAVRNYEVCLSCGAGGIAISANWLFKMLERPERQKDILPVLLANNRLRPRTDIKQLTQSCGIYDYELSLSAAEKIIINHDNFYVASDALEKLHDRYTAFRGDLIASGYKNI